MSRAEMWVKTHEGDAMKRHAMKRGKSKKLFQKTGSKMDRKNVPSASRGDFRL